MEEMFLSVNHMERFMVLASELDFKDISDPYWRSLMFIISGDEQLFSRRAILVNAEYREIISEAWFNGEFSGGEQRLLLLAYNLFTNQDYYEQDDNEQLYISPLDIFSGLDEQGYELAKNAIDVRLKF
jgi:hypothetical protein